MTKPKITYQVWNVKTNLWDDVKLDTIKPGMTIRKVVMGEIERTIETKCNKIYHAKKDKNGKVEIFCVNENRAENGEKE